MSQKPLKKILFVDDDTDILKIAQLSLKALEGIEITYLQSGDEVINTALTFQPDMVILDVIMPGTDGLTVLKNMKQHPELKSIPVVFLTARVLNTEVEEYKKFGVAGVLVKPFDPLTLPDMVLKQWELTSH